MYFECTLKGTLNSLNSYYMASLHLTVSIYINCTVTIVSIYLHYTLSIFTVYLVSRDHCSKKTSNLLGTTGMSRLPAVLVLGGPTMPAETAVSERRHRGGPLFILAVALALLLAAIGYSSRNHTLNTVCTLSPFTKHCSKSLQNCSLPENTLCCQAQDRLSVWELVCLLGCVLLLGPPGSNCSRCGSRLLHGNPNTTSSLTFCFELFINSLLPHTFLLTNSFLHLLYRLHFYVELLIIDKLITL